MAEPEAVWSWRQGRAYLQDLRDRVLAAVGTVSKATLADLKVLSDIQEIGDPMRRTLGTAALRRKYGPGMVACRDYR